MPKFAINSVNRNNKEKSLQAILLQASNLFLRWNPQAAIADLLIKVKITMVKIPERPLLRYFGSKFNLRRWIESHFPYHYLYCEPFGGGASVLCQKKPSKIEVYNDLDSRVVNFFRVLRESPGELIRQIELTPYSRIEWELSYEVSADPVEDARRFYVCAWQSRTGGYLARNPSEWRIQNKRWGKGVNVFSDWDRHSDLWDFSQRLRGVYIENDEANSVIERYDTPETLFYVDPPYLHSTRSKSHLKLYFHEMDDSEHVHLAELLRRVKGFVILSGYWSELYDELYSGWKRVEKQTRTNANTEAIECLWVSPNCYSAQMPLFQSLEGEKA